MPGLLHRQILPKNFRLLSPEVDEFINLKNRVDSNYYALLNRIKGELNALRIFSTQFSDCIQWLNEEEVSTLTK